MKPYGVLLVVILSIASLAQSNSLNPTESSNSVAEPIRDAQAISAVAIAIKSLGGDSALSAIQSAKIEGQIAGTQNDTVYDGTFVWEDDFTKATPEFRSETRINGHTELLVSNHGHPVHQNEHGQNRLGQHVLYAMMPVEVPGVLLARQLADPRYSIQWIGTESLNGAPVAHIRTSLNIDLILNAVTPEDWYFDARSGLPARVDCKSPDARNALESSNTRISYSNWGMVDGTLLPFTLTSESEGSSPITITVRKFTFNIGPMAADFEPRQGGRQ